MTTVREQPAGATGPQARGRTFAALSHTRYRMLFFVGLLSFLAVQIQMIARGWLAYELTGSNSGLGGVYLGFGIPMLLATPWGGVAADRISKRRVLIAALILLAITSFWIGAGVEFHFVRYWMLVAASSLQGVAFAFLGPARMAFTGELVPREDLPNAVVLGQMSLNSTRIIGPAVAGVLIGAAATGTAWAYFLSFGIIVVSIVIAVVYLPPGLAATGRPVRTPLAEMADGVRYVRSRPELSLLVVTSFMVVMIAFPYIAFLPDLSDRIFNAGSAGYGALSAVSAVGALSASLFIASRAGGGGAWRFQARAGFLFGAGVLLLGAAPTFLLALPVVLVVGAAASVFQSMNNSLVLSLADLEYHGRVQSLMMLSFSGFGMAALPLGILADTIGLRRTLGAMGFVTLITMTVYQVVRNRRTRGTRFD